MRFRRSLAGAAQAFLLAVSASNGGCAAPPAQDFAALPDDGPGVAVYAAGDIADCRKTGVARSGAAETAEVIERGLANDPEAKVLALGDATYPIGLAAEFTGCYDPTWGRFKARTLPAPGNHEYYSPGAADYYRYFGDAAGPGHRGYYAATVGDWRVISLNSNLRPPADAAQLAWLKGVLADDRHRCTLAFWHHPRYSSGGHGNNDKMAAVWKMLADAGVDLVLAGHDHDYERFAPIDGNGRRDDARGMRSFVVGTGGAELTLIAFHKLNSEVRYNDTPGVLRLALKPDSYEWKYLPAEPTRFRDAGAGACH
ncbi:MAG: metallophosphoesterase family protein [Burkholderiaceae bacterium]